MTIEVHIRLCHPGGLRAKRPPVAVITEEHIHRERANRVTDKRHSRPHSGDLVDVLLSDISSSVTAESNIITSLKDGLKTDGPFFPKFVEYHLSPQS